MITGIVSVQIGAGLAGRMFAELAVLGSGIAAGLLSSVIPYRLEMETLTLVQPCAGKCSHVLWA